MSSDQHPEAKPKEHKVVVAVVTTSGVFPAEGHVQEPFHQKVIVVLRKAADSLHLTDTSNWIAKVHGRDIDPQKSYEENGLTGEFDIDWGPREGGGGFR